MEVVILASLSGVGVSAVHLQPASAIWSIRLLMGPIPSIFLLGGILFALYYPLTREQIAARRAIAD